LLCAAVAGLLTVARASCAKSQPLDRPVPRPAIAAIADAFNDYRLVAIAEGHRNQQVHDFIVALIRDPRFLPAGGDIVVEFGNARYQAVMDRYTRGDSLPAGTIVPVWRDAMNILVWDAPVYARFFETVRSVNQRRPASTRLRVLLADPPIDWKAIHQRAEWERFALTRDSNAADVAEREVLARNRRALLIFGSGHVIREGAYGPQPGRVHHANLAELLEQHHPGTTLLIWAHMAGWMTNALDPRLARWPIPSLARLPHTWLGGAYVGPAGTPRLEDLADAFLYLGPIASLTTSTPSPDLYRDTTYLRELLRRNAIQGGANTSELEVLRKRFLK
jgi:hypothetical protein